MKRVGFNFQWIYSSKGQTPGKVVEPELDFLVDNGFNFVRIPTDYRFWTDGFNYDKIDERVIECIDEYIEQVIKRGLHASLNMHRVPGYCINGADREIHNLWRDKEAQDGFKYQWQYFAKRYAGISSDKLSFDLVNEPNNIPPTHPCTRDDHEKVIRSTIAAVREVDPSREIVIDGFNGGGTALPELADAGVIHSGRGYEPFHLTHYRAEWVFKGRDDLPEPKYPGEVSPGNFKNIDTLREFYKPWKEVEATGCKIHFGECGVYNKLPNHIALTWFKDLITVFNENNWGYALWNFKGPFGICEHGRPGAEYTEIGGLKIDKAMLDIMKTSL